ncbi:MAG: hypothetical protein ABH831_00750 [Candidatus Nealsonbacteria bacterium]
MKIKCPFRGNRGGEIKEQKIWEDLTNIVNRLKSEQITKKRYGQEKDKKEKIRLRVFVEIGPKKKFDKIRNFFLFFFDDSRKEPYNRIKKL